MKILFFISILLITTYFSTAFSQESDVEENESSESILEREEFINERRAGGPERVLPKYAYEQAVLQKNVLHSDRDFPNSPTFTSSWQSVNPTGMFYSVTNANYISGRNNSIVFHPSNPDIFYVAAAQGGVWKTIDGGLNWTVLTDDIGSIASGDIAIDKNNPNILYYGTGELNYSLDSQYGDGIYKSTNAGVNWTKISPASQTGTYTGKILIDPSNSDIVLAAGNAGLYRSSDAGTNWALVQSGNFSSMIINKSTPSIMYASTGSGTSIIYKSTNSGINWSNVSTISTGRRTQIAISPDNPNYIYASVAASSGALLGLYRTTNGGDNWTLQASSPNYMSTQGWYDNAVTVIPGNPDGVVVAGLDVYVSTNGGASLIQKSNWSTGNTANFSHADVHYLTYNGSVLYCCSDGGVYKSTNNGNEWSDMNAKISTLQFQSADYDPLDVNNLYGGCQDNNKQTSTNNGVIWLQRTTGDGGYTAVDPVNTNYVYGQYVNGSIQRSTNFGVSFTNITPSSSSGGLFYNPYEIAPGDHNTVVFARADVWKSTTIQTASSSTGWSQIATTGVISGSASAIGISSQTVNKIYIGTSNGKILVTTNNGTNWSVQTGFPYVTDLCVDINDDNICYATFGGVVATTHVYKTTNGGANWFTITSNLPNLAVNSIVKRQTSPEMLFVGTDLGVFQSTNDGADWTKFNTGFPNVEVYDLKYKENPKILLAATHGRGCFKFDLSTIVSISEQNIIPDKFTLKQNYPNPFNPSTKISYELPFPDFVTLKVYDALGNEISSLVNQDQKAGKYEIDFNASKLSSGVYFYKLSAGELIQTKSMLLIK